MKLIRFTSNYISVSLSSTQPQNKMIQADSLKLYINVSSQYIHAERQYFFKPASNSINTQFHSFKNLFCIHFQNALLVAKPIKDLSLLAFYIFQCLQVWLFWAVLNNYMIHNESVITIQNEIAVSTLRSERILLFLKSD